MHRMWSSLTREHYSATQGTEALTPARVTIKGMAWKGGRSQSEGTVDCKIPLMQHPEQAHPQREAWGSRGLGQGRGVAAAGVEI